MAYYSTMPRPLKKFYRRRRYKRLGGAIAIGAGAFGVLHRKKLFGGLAKARRTNGFARSALKDFGSIRRAYRRVGSGGGSLLKKVGAFASRSRTGASLLKSASGFLRSL